MKKLLIALGIGLATVLTPFVGGSAKAQTAPTGTLTVTAEGQNVSVTGTYADSVDWGTTVSWGDGATVAYPGFSGGITDSHFYTNVGTYNVTLTVQGESGSYVTTHAIAIGGSPIGSVEVTQGADRTVSVYVVYNHSYDWGTTLYWGHDNSLVGFPGVSGTYTVPHQYPSSGTYTLTLVVEGPGGPYTTTQEVVVTDPVANLPTGSIEVLSVDPLLREAQVYLTYADSYDWGTTLYWGHDDSFVTFPNFSGSNTVTHQFPGPGTYTVSLVVEGVGGPYIQSQEIVFDDPNAGPPSGTLELQITDAASRIVSVYASYQNSYDWGSTLYWGHDNSLITFPGFSGSNTVTHQFPGPGTYTVSFVVEGVGGPYIVNRTVSFFN